MTWAFLVRSRVLVFFVLYDLWCYKGEEDCSQNLFATQRSNSPSRLYHNARYSKETLEFGHSLKIKPRLLKSRTMIITITNISGKLRQFKFNTHAISYAKNSGLSGLRLNEISNSDSSSSYTSTAETKVAFCEDKKTVKPLLVSWCSSFAPSGSGPVVSPP